MPIRLWLALCIAALCALALVVVSATAYGVYARDQYRTIDRVLLLSAQYIAAGVRVAGRSYALENDGRPPEDGLEVVLRQYGPTGRLVRRSPNDPGLPVGDPHAALQTPAQPAFAGGLPALFGGTVAAPPGAAFGTLPVDGTRWRRAVIRVEGPGGRLVGFVEGVTPLARLDEGTARLRGLLTRLTLASVLAALALSWALAGAGLAPIDRVTNTARDIARSRDLTRRVPARRRADEVGRLAATFNDMLASLQRAWDSQQRFVADASHELRAPLTVMRGNLELLRRHPVMPAAERAEMLADVEREAARLARLVTDLLLLARSDAGERLARRDVDAAAVALEAFRDAKVLANGQHLVFVPGGAVRVTGDPDRLKQLVLILLDNAVKFTPPGGRVELSLERANGRAVLRVRDEGRGVPPADRPFVFDRFYRADPSRGPDPGGTGLGLAIARWIVEQHEGRIALDGAEGRGTLVTVDLPLAGTGAPTSKTV